MEELKKVKYKTRLGSSRELDFNVVGLIKAEPNFKIVFGFTDGSTHDSQAPKWLPLTIFASQTVVDEKHYGVIARYLLEQDLASDMVHVIELDEETKFAFTTDARYKGDPKELGVSSLANFKTSIPNEITNDKNSVEIFTLVDLEEELTEPVPVHFEESVKVEEQVPVQSNVLAVSEEVEEEETTTDTLKDAFDSAQEALEAVASEEISLPEVTSPVSGTVEGLDFSETTGEEVTNNSSLEENNSSLEENTSSIEDIISSLESSNEEVEVSTSSLEQDTSSLETNSNSLEQDNSSVETDNFSLEHEKEVKEETSKPQGSIILNAIQQRKASETTGESVATAVKEKEEILPPNPLLANSQAKGLQDLATEKETNEINAISKVVQDLASSDNRSHRMIIAGTDSIVQAAYVKVQSETLGIYATDANRVYFITTAGVVMVKFNASPLTGEKLSTSFIQLVTNLWEYEVARAKKENRVPVVENILQLLVVL